MQQPLSSEQQPPFQSADSGAVDEADVNVAVAGVDPEFNDQEAAQQAGACAARRLEREGEGGRTERGGWLRSPLAVS